MGKRRRRDPTQEGEEREDAFLEEKYKKLEEHWNLMTCKVESNPSCGHDKVLRRCSSSSVDQLFNKYSPRELMSSLQVKQRRSAPPPNSQGRGYMMMMFNSKVREENDDMLVELLRDRLSAIQSGKLKGRRLFQDSDDDDDDDDDDELDLDHGEEEICGDCFDHLIITQQSEQQLKSVVSSYASDDDDELSSSSSSSSSSLIIISNEKLVDQREKAVVVAMERENNVAGEKIINIGKGGRVKNNNNMAAVAMAWLGIIVLMLFVIWMSCNRWVVGTEDDDVEVFLVPT